MPITEPYLLPFLSSILAPISDCQFELVRFEEASGSGSGQFWTAELADPLWQVTLNLSPRQWAAAREINAKVNGLGSRGTLLFVDRSYRPAAGDNPGAAAEIEAVTGDRTALRINNLTAGYRITAGDRFSVEDGGVSRYFGEIVETATANSAGRSTVLSVVPPLPQWIAPATPLTLSQPVVRLRVPPGGFTPFRQVPGGMSTGASLTMMQKL